MPVDTFQQVRVTESDDTLTLVATHRIDDDAFLRDHFPGFSIYPGVFLVEGLCSAVRRALSDDERRLGISILRSARFLTPLFPGDTVELEAQVRPWPAPGPVVVEAVFRHGAERVAEIKAEFAYAA